jgi:hypothetical protein
MMPSKVQDLARPWEYQLEFLHICSQWPCLALPASMSCVITAV